MIFPRGQYWSATRHPWSCVLFVVPLLAIYELGLFFLGPGPMDAMRNGADVWLRSWLASVGISPTYGAPMLLLLILLTWTLIYREDRPRDPVGVWVGMAVESVVFALLLYGLSRGLWPMFRSLGILLDSSAAKPILLTVAPQAPEPAVVYLIRYLGAGIYEETLFRLLLFLSMLAVLTVAELPRLWSICLAALGSALLFAGAHNLGPQGEAFYWPVFLFRTMAGVFFAWIFCIRGFGIAVGVHAGYDVLVGLLMRG